jgi:hypothetical protein
VVVDRGVLEVGGIRGLPAGFCVVSIFVAYVVTLE